MGAVAEGVAGVGVGSSVGGDGASIMKEREIGPQSRGMGREMVVERREREVRLKEPVLKVITYIP